VMSDVSCADFDEFLAILYPTDFRRPKEKTTAQWTSILHLSAKWAFENIQLLAIDNLTAHATPIDKIVLGRRYGITEWLAGAYEAVCTRADPLTLEEGMKLGVEDTVRVSAARQLYGTGAARYDAKYLTGDLGEIFRLEQLSDGGPTSVDREEEMIKALEAQIAEARAELLASPTPPVGACLDQILDEEAFGLFEDYTDCGSCGGCKLISDTIKEGNTKKEAMEEKERQLGDLKSKLEARRQEPAEVGRQRRMSSFR